MSIREAPTTTSHDIADGGGNSISQRCVCRKNGEIRLLLCYRPPFIKFLSLSLSRYPDATSSIRYRYAHDNSPILRAEMPRSCDLSPSGRIISMEIDKVSDKRTPWGPWLKHFPVHISWFQRYDTLIIELFEHVESASRDCCFGP